MQRTGFNPVKSVATQVQIITLTQLWNADLSKAPPPPFEYSTVSFNVMFTVPV